MRERVRVRAERGFVGKRARGRARRRWRCRSIARKRDRFFSTCSKTLNRFFSATPSRLARKLFKGKHLGRGFRDRKGILKSKILGRKNSSKLTLRLKKSHSVFIK